MTLSHTQSQAHLQAHLQELLLDLLSTNRIVAPEAIARLGTQDWGFVLERVKQHRLGPLLHWRLTRERGALPIPADISAQLAESFKMATLRALLMQRELLLTHRILARAGIPHAALKGAYLAYHAYPHPALRPLRDLDLLVPSDQALPAYQALIEGGLARWEKYPGNPEACSELNHHLPPLRAPSGQFSVELHNRISHLEPGHECEQQADPAEDPLFWQRFIQRDLGGDSISFLSATDLALHLIVQAIFDHQLNNGPLIFSDLAYLLASHEIDWPLFWILAEERGQSRACVLMLRLVERYFGSQAVDWPEMPGVPDWVLEQAALATLADSDARRDVAVHGGTLGRASLPEKIAYLLYRARPPRKRIETMYPVSGNRVYFGYVMNWWRLATRRIPEYLRSRQDGELVDESRRMSRLQQWVREPG